MAIKKGLRPTIAEVGKIKIGEKGEEYTTRNNKKARKTVRLDYFKITTTEREGEKGDGNYIQDATIHELVGDKPRELRIRLPFDTIDKNFFTQFMAYSGGKKVCAGDGETATRKGQLSVDSSGKYPKLKVTGEEPNQVECDIETCPIFAAGLCKICGILSCFLADAPDVGGIHKFRTHGWNATNSILGALEYFSKNTGGILQGLPLKLVMVKKTTQDHGTINYATVVIDGEEIRGLRRLALEEKKARQVMLVDMSAIEAEAEAAGLFDDNEDEQMIQDEFYSQPEPIKQAAVPEKKKGASADDVLETLKGKDAEEVSGTVEDDTNITIGDETGKGEAMLKPGKPAEKPAKKPEKPEPEKKAPGSNLEIF